MRDDVPDDPRDRSDDDASAEVRIALTPRPTPRSVILWRLRLGGLSLAGVIVLGGAPVGMLFIACMGLAVVILAGGSAMARLELHVHRLRTERRR